MAIQKLDNNKPALPIKIKMLKEYLEKIKKTSSQGVAREESSYSTEIQKRIGKIYPKMERLVI